MKLGSDPGCLAGESSASLFFFAAAETNVAQSFSVVAANDEAPIE